jgi:hypothetical protein
LRRIALLVLLMSLTQACFYRPVAVSVPTISDSKQQGWYIESRCEGKGCVDKYDILIGKDIQIEVRPYNERFRPGTIPFLISLTFRFIKPGSYMYDPQLTYLTMHTKDSFYAKPAKNVSFRYSPPKSRLEYTYDSRPVVLRTDQSPNGSDTTSLNLLFDVPAPSVDETFQLFIEGVWLNKTPVRVPALTFSRGER